MSNLPPSESRILNTANSTSTINRWSSKYLPVDRKNLRKMSQFSWRLHCLKVAARWGCEQTTHLVARLRQGQRACLAAAFKKHDFETLKGLHANSFLELGGKGTRVCCFVATECARDYFISSPLFYSCIKKQAQEASIHIYETLGRLIDGVSLNFLPDLSVSPHNFIAAHYDLGGFHLLEHLASRRFTTVTLIAWRTLTYTRIFSAWHSIVWHCHSCRIPLCERQVSTQNLLHGLKQLFQNFQTKSIRYFQPALNLNPKYAGACNGSPPQGG